MAPSKLIFRLAGMTALCVAFFSAPLSENQQVGVLVSFSVGVAVAAVTPARDRLAATLVGPAALLVAVAPLTPSWAIVDLACLVIVGFAALHQAGMSRLAPASALPLAALGFRTGEPPSTASIAVWLAAVVVMVLAGSWPETTDRQPSDDKQSRGIPSMDTQSTSTSLSASSRHRPMMIAATIGLLAVPSYLFAQVLDEVLPDAVRAARFGAPGGAELQSHPGLVGGLDVGSPVSLSDEVVLRVKSDQPNFWRGTTYDSWDGRRWSNSGTSVALEWSGAAVRLPELPGLGSESESLPGLELPDPVRTVQHFTTERSGFDVALGTWKISSLWTTARGARLGDDGSVLLDEPLQAGATWTAESSVVPATTSQLRRADPMLLDPASPILQRFAVETNVTPEVAELAASITANSPTTLDKVGALEAWLDANITYTRDIDELPADADAVHHLLFDSKTGFCEQIGSALVVMLRSLGVPARLTVGYVPGTFDAESGEWLSRGSDAHTWAEVYFPGVGWQGFDPTAGVPQAPPDSNAGTDTPTLVVVSLLGLIAVTMLVILIARVTASLISAPPVAVPTGLVALQQRLDECGDSMGCQWTPATTLREKRDDLAVAGVPAETTARACLSLERAWYLDLEQPAATELNTAVIEHAVVDLEQAVIDTLARQMSSPVGCSEPEPTSSRRGRGPRSNPSDNLDQSHEHPESQPTR